MSVEDLLGEYQGHIVPQSYNAGFVALSFVVSLVGAASTLELINRRTGFRGLFNHVLLVSSAVTMGGIAIWCMHFIGNRAIDLANGQRELQVAYSSGFTAISFFVPIIVLLAAFVAVGTNNVVSWWRVIVGGILCGAAVCGMHYLGNASMANYHCVYRPAYVIGAAIIAVVASIVALAMFFVFRAMWASSWWKRGFSAIVLAGAVSGMHWCAAVGTQYRLVDIKSKDNTPSRSATVIVVICLSLGACFIIAGSAILRARNMRKSASRAQQITLGAAIFDKDGKILVDPDGFIPSTVVTDSFLEKNTKEGFSIAHPLFHWMFQASRNWGGVSTLLNGMRHHLTELPHSGSHKDGRRGIQLINDHGEMIEGYDSIFRELFCLAAAALGDRLREHLTSVGVLWDEILPTGASTKRSQAHLQRHPRVGPSLDNDGVTEESHGSIDMAEKGVTIRQEEYGRGSLMLLVRRVGTDREAERLVAAGYRFAELHQVSDIIRTSMQIQSPGFESKLRDMATYSEQQIRMQPGVHLGFFAIRARVSGGFEVLVRNGARNLLPSAALPMKKIEKWHVEFLRRFDGLTVPRLLQNLADDHALPRSAKEMKFIGQLGDAIKILRESTEEPLFEDAMLTSTIVRLPCQDEGRQAETTMVTLRLVIPIHSVLSSANCEMVPLSFFKMRQIMDQCHQEFVRGIHREFAPIVKTSGRGMDGIEETASRLSSKLWRFGRPDTSMGAKLNSKSTIIAAGRRVSSSDSIRTGSTTNLCPPGGGNRSQSIDTVDESGLYPSREVSQQPPPSYGGIMVFQEITINVEEGQQSEALKGRSESQDTIIAEPPHVLRKASTSSRGIELQTMGHMGHNVHAGPQVINNVETQNGDISNIPSFVDVLFAECVETR
ncbi:Fc.00g029670.m01.CDS01 [Cosmosporella sp. VM-42]